MTASARERRLAALAAVAVVAAGLALSRDQRPAQRVEQPGASLGTVATVPPPAVVPAAALRVARAYARATRNWSAASFRRAYRRQLALAAGLLARELAAHAPTHRQLEQLRSDASSCLAIVLGTHARVDGGGVSVRLRLAELHELDGNHTRSSRWYALRLRHQRTWRATSFTVVRGRS